MNEINYEIKRKREDTPNENGISEICTTHQMRILKGYRLHITTVLDIIKQNLPEKSNLERATEHEYVAAIELKNFITNDSKQLVNPGRKLENPKFQA